MPNNLTENIKKWKTFLKKRLLIKDIHVINQTKIKNKKERK